MAEVRVYDLIDGLADGLTPVRRLRPPALRAALWLGAVAAVAVLFYVVLGGQFERVATRPFLLPAFLAAVATAIAAAVAAFEVSLPDRSDRWLLLPLPLLALWMAFSGLGCLADLGNPAAWGDTWIEMRQCLTVILGSALLVSPVLVLMLRRARPDRAVRVALLAGLASAAGAGGILLLVHPHNSTVLDLLVHAVCIAAVIGLNTVLGGKLLAGTRTRDRA